MNLIPFALFTFDRLTIKPPPANTFEEILGYSGNLRFVGFCYKDGALQVADGQVIEVGDRWPWSIWYRTLGVQIFKHYCFGYDGRSPDHMLILDRKSRTLYSGPVHAALEALMQQIPGVPKTVPETWSQPDVGGSDEDPTEFLESRHLTAERERLRAKRTEGVKKLKIWLGFRCYG